MTTTITDAEAYKAIAEDRVAEVARLETVLRNVAADITEALTPSAVSATPNG